MPLEQIPRVPLPRAEGALVQADTGVDAHVVLERLFRDERLSALRAVEDRESAVRDRLVQLSLDVQVHPPLADAAETRPLAQLALVLLREVDEGEVPPPRAVVPEELVALGALHLDGLLLVHHLDVVVPGAGRGQPLAAVVAHEAVAVAHPLVVRQGALVDALGLAAGVVAAELPLGVRLVDRLDVTLQAVGALALDTALVAHLRARGGVSPFLHAAAAGLGGIMEPVVQPDLRPLMPQF